MRKDDIQKRILQKNNVKDLLFYKYIGEMCILAD